MNATGTPDPRRYASKDASVVERVRASIRANGLGATLARAAEFAGARVRPWMTPIMRPAVRRNGFDYDGHLLQPAVFAHNATWSNERIVELAVVRYELDRNPGRVLEIGAVLRHYPELDVPDRRTTVDKYERADGVIASDLFDYAPPSDFDLVVSVSTIEHFGVDEHDHPEQPDRAIDALRYIAAVLLAPGGRGVVTVPLGYNPALDAVVDGSRGVDGVSVAAVYRRTTGLTNRWERCRPVDVATATYGARFRTASAVAVLVVRPSRR